MSHDPQADEAAQDTLRRSARRRLVWALGAAAAAAGCGGGSGREPDAAARFTPAPSLARDALQAALEDWKAGLAPERIKRLSVPVQVVDKRRRPGQTLEDYEILGETPADSARCFAVRLKLNRPEAEERVRYVVIGIDPLWVFRQEDFNSICQWECPPEKEPADSSIAESDLTGGESGSGAEASVPVNRNATAPDEAGDSSTGITGGGGIRDHHENHSSAGEAPRETGDRGRK